MKNAIRLSLPHEKYPKTRIVATVGKKSMAYGHLREMVEAGVTFFRLNGAHIEKNPSSTSDNLSHEDVAEIAMRIRRLRSEFRQLIGLYFDLGGPKIRVHRILGVKTIGKDNCLHPKQGDRVTLYMRSTHLDKVFDALLNSHK